MTLYHGSNITIECPKIIISKRLLDFGAGFYLTSDFEQAGRWAERTTRARGGGHATVSVFDTDENTFSRLKILSFDGASAGWLHFVCANRQGKVTDEDFDVVKGPVANDQVVRTINNFLRGYFDEEIALRLLLPQKITDQYAFKTQKALDTLGFREGRLV